MVGGLISSSQLYVQFVGPGNQLFEYPHGKLHRHATNYRGVVDSVVNRSPLACEHPELAHGRECTAHVFRQIMTGRFFFVRRRFIRLRLATCARNTGGRWKLH